MPEYILLRISIHAPRVGSDALQEYATTGDLISIHAPRVGSDAMGKQRLRLDSDFNPRSPCGERPLSYNGKNIVNGISIHAPRVGSDDTKGTKTPAYIIFQSTLPVWGATSIKTASDLSVTVFQSTLPVWGATASLPGHQRPGRNFNPRSPCGERRTPTIRTQRHRRYFNPRSPCGERRRCYAGKNHRLAISIHAPRVGSDEATEVHHIKHADISIHAPRVGSDGILL